MEFITKIYIENVNGVVRCAKLKKILKKTNLLQRMYELLQMEDIGETISSKIYIFGPKTSNIEFLKTFIDLLQSQFLEKKMLKVEK